MLSAVMFGKWTDHVKGWRSAELGDRILFITYEEMCQVKHKHVETAYSPKAVILLTIAAEGSPKQAARHFDGSNKTPPLLPFV